MSSNDDHKLFRESIQGTKPLKQDKRDLRPLKKSKVLPFTDTIETISYDEIDSTYFEEVGAEEVLFYARPHIPEKQIRQLRQGKIVLQAKLDLHGKTMAETDTAINHFIHQCEQQGKRFALIIHGKGGRNLLNKATLKSFVNNKLINDARILAFCSAKSQ